MCLCGGLWVDGRLMATTDFLTTMQTGFGGRFNGEESGGFSIDSRNRIIYTEAKSFDGKRVSSTCVSDSGKSQMARESTAQLWDLHLHHKRQRRVNETDYILSGSCCPNGRICMQTIRGFPFAIGSTTQV